MFEKRKLASAVATAIGTSVAAVGVAQAEVSSVMFPTVVASPTVTTVVSVINDGRPIVTSDTPNIPGDQALHYTYWHKQLESGETIRHFNAKICKDRNRFLPTSKYDLVTFDLSGQFFGDDNGVMFNDPSVGVNITPDWVFYEESPKPQRGVLFVDNYNLQGLDYIAGDGPIAGEAILFEVSTGAAWGYQGFMIAGDSGDYSGFSSGSRSRVPFMPPAEVTTLILATPTLDPETGAPVDQIKEQGNLTAWVGVRGILGDDPIDAPRGIFDRDEKFISGGDDQLVTCVGGWTIEDLFSDAVNADGGWTHITNYMEPTDTDSYPDPVSPAAMVFKVEYGDVENLDAANNRVPGTGLWNNGFYLHPDPAITSSS
jgi:hypothetical protein